MSTEALLQSIQTNGFAIIPAVIPAGAVAAVRDEIVAVQARHHAENEEALRRTRSRGHRVGARGVGALRQVLAESGDRLYFNLTNFMLWYLTYVEDVLEGQLPEVRPHAPEALVAA